ncbi:glutamine--fructose-6-phosphate transaminase [Longilinea arvoryzae]|uniref:Glutamine--fructose-6-phosphate aminotransferase [isomerizing] n=1 Tax=Longilinea arvoryzae TaxID=360412 RepID=A0A0S7BG38_9CHLR|nr:glutamine--fructose-6-phosphate transaminase (isomerizing) [Longilinea arvoryzae]GAP14557.1 glutamine--fructose-6-phosphate transaminase [Longilinea arvoryzae]
MCGIVGYIGGQNATPIILNGLRRLEYRGYDSAGLAVLQNGKIEIRRDAGKLDHLVTLVTNQPVEGNLGIGHTRWATHGEPNARNAHPHLGSTGEVVLVHNGIVENFLELREELEAEGEKFNSDTDSEIIVHLIEHAVAAGHSLENATRLALKQIKGAHGIVVFSSREPDKIVAARIGNAGGVVIGLGEDENYVASDIPAIVEHTRRMMFLESRQMAVITRADVKIETLEGKPVQPEIHTISWDPIAAEKGEYRHFMQKEIHEQVRSLTDTLAGRVNFDEGKVRLPHLNLTPEKALRIKQVILTACGTASYAAQVGEVLIERIARIPAKTVIASELRYNDPIIDENTVVLAISQSGETADTLAAMDECRKRGATLWSIVNAIGSQAMRVADGYISMQAGPEIGVASTKAFTAPLVDLYILAVLLADLRGVITPEQRRKLVSDLRLVPDLVGRCLDREAGVIQVAREMKYIHNMLYLGRGINMPIAFEGALKLKEISYIHAEGYAAGEMKHGPIALVDRDMPVLAIAPRDPWYEKMISQIEQARARGGGVIVVATDGDERVAALADHVFWIPETPWMLSPVVTVIPLQLFAYHIASLKGLDVDQPRNLAKSVTVE